MDRTTTPPPSAPADPKRRIVALDALRGFALCGIVFINIPQTMEMFTHVGQVPEGLRLFVLGRFYPIFYLLFGIGFGIFLHSAARRTARPRLMLLRRLVALGVLGALLHLIQPGEVLLPFALTGLVVLLPLSFLGARAVLAVGVALTAAGVLLGVGGFGVLPGLFALGFAFASLGVPGAVEERIAPAAATAAVALAVAATAYGLIFAGLPAPVQPWLGMLLSLATSACYLAVFLLLLRTPLGSLLAGLLAPMGRMALTNYVTQALLFVPVGTALGLPGSSAWGVSALLATAILVVQAVWSRLWLARLAYGPLEWAWRCVTYWRVPPIRAGSAG